MCVENNIDQKGLFLQIREQIEWILEDDDEMARLQLTNKVDKDNHEYFRNQSEVSSPSSSHASSSSPQKSKPLSRRVSSYKNTNKKLRKIKENLIYTSSMEDLEVVLDSYLVHTEVILSMLNDVYLVAHHLYSYVTFDCFLSLEEFLLMQSLNIAGSHIHCRHRCSCYDYLG